MANTAGVATISDLQAVERSMRELLDGEGLQQPDEVDYAEASIVLLWHDAKLTVVIDVTDDCLEPLLDDERQRSASPPRSSART
jgi:hypothetical protein